jgi:hypothetical protein
MVEYKYRDKEFENAVSMANYILECDKQDKLNEEKIKRERLKAEKASKQKELDDVYDEYLKTCEVAKEKYNKVFYKYIKDYGNDGLNANMLYTIDMTDYMEKVVKLPYVEFEKNTCILYYFKDDETINTFFERKIIEWINSHKDEDFRLKLFKKYRIWK